MEPCGSIWRGRIVAAVKRQKHFLSNILGLMRVPENPKCDIDDTAVFTGEEMVEGGAILFPAGLHPVVDG